jgi:hypothetical protein
LVLGIFPGQAAPEICKAYQLLESMAKKIEAEADGSKYPKGPSTMKLSKRSLRGIRAFNHLKYNTKNRVYNIKRHFLENPIDKYVTSYKEVKNDTNASEPGPLVGGPLSGEVGSSSL